jgi:hypothetical protein
LSKFTEFWQSSCTRRTKAQKTPSNQNGFRQSFHTRATRRSPDRPSEPHHSPDKALHHGMRALQVESPKCGVSPHFHHRGVLIGPWGSSTDLEKSVWHQVVACRPSHMTGRPGGVASTNFLHRLGLLVLEAAGKPS